MRAAITTLLLLALAVPATAQSRVIIAPTESPAATVRPQTLLCPYCTGKSSTVRYAKECWSVGDSITLTPAINHIYDPCREPYGDVYWDEEGRFHDHNIPSERFVCSEGHAWTQYLRRCWCDWPEHLRVRTDQQSDARPQTVLPGVTLIWDDNGNVTVTHTDEPPQLKPLPFTQADLDRITRQLPAPLYTPGESKASFDDPWFWIGVGSAAGWYAGDAITTHIGHKRGFLEAGPTRNDDGTANLKVATAVTCGLIGLAALLQAKGHRKAARFVLFFTACTHAFGTIHNLTVLE